MNAEYQTVLLSIDVYLLRDALIHSRDAAAKSRFHIQNIIVAMESVKLYHCKGPKDSAYVKLTKSDEQRLYNTFIGACIAG